MAARFHGESCRRCFEILERQKKEKIDSNLTILYGKNDKKLNDQINEWRDYANNKYSSYVFDGDHFFIHSLEEDVVTQIITILNRYHL